MASLALAAILGLALVMRLGWPALAEFKLDEAGVARRGLAIAYEGERPVMGVGASLGMSQLPLFLYVMAVPLRIWPDPLAAVLFVGLLSSLAVLACYAIGRAYFGQAVGLAAAFLFAVNPWAILYGRKIWSQNIPLLTLGFVAAVLATFVTGRRWALVTACAALVALISLHLGGLSFVLVLAILMLLYPGRVSRWPLLVGGGVLAAALCPYVIYDAQHDWVNLQAFLHYGGGAKHLSAHALQYAFNMSGSQGIQALAGSRFEAYLAGLPNAWWLDGLMQGLLALALLYALVQAVRGTPERRPIFVILLLWFAVPIALQTWSSAPVYPHYFILLYPLQFLLVAACLLEGLPRLPWPSPAVLKSVLLLLALVWGSWQIAVVGRLFFFMQRYPTTGGYGIPLLYPRQAAGQARQLAGEREIIVLGLGTDPHTDETPAVFEALLFDHPHRFADGRWALPLAGEPGAVYVAGPLQEPGSELGWLAAWPAEAGSAQVDLPDGWRYQIFELDRQAVLDSLTPLAEPLLFANDVACVGYSLPSRLMPGEELEVWLAWDIRLTPPAGVDYHFFTHLVDRDGLRYSQHDGAGFPTPAWRSGDGLLSRFVIPVPADLPPGSYWVRAGMYTYPDVAGVPAVDGTDAVYIGPLEIGQGAGL